MYFVYILQSLKDNSFYIGFTGNLYKRLEEHNSGKSKYTSSHRPYRLISFTTFLDENDAKHHEEYLKSGYGRRSIKKMLKNYLSFI